MRRTKIVATIGPASREPDTLVRMIEAGLDVARLNFSHGSREIHAENVERIRAAAARADRQVAIMQDLPGPKLRIGALKEDIVELKPGERLVLVGGASEPGDEKRMSVTWGGLAGAVDPEDVIYLADGAIRLRVARVREGDGEIETQVEVGGAVASRQGLNIPGSTRGLPAVPEDDLEMLRFGESIGVDIVALSFVRTAEDVTSVRRHTRLPLVAKIEKPQAVESADEIIRAADTVMVARGDLGIELPIEDVPMVQKRLLRIAGKLARPSITATQMLDSMVSSSRPTRAEVADVANAILDGTDAVMLSGETARGAYPLEAVRVMATIAIQVEAKYPFKEIRRRRSTDYGGIETDEDIGMSIAEAAVGAADGLGLRLVVSGTTTGNTARHISSFRPRAKIVALTPLEEVARRMAVVWGVEASVVQTYRYIETLIEIAEARVVAEGHAAPGETIAITSGMPVGAGGTNVLKIHRLPEH
jgi:pyruvate kinase